MSFYSRQSFSVSFFHVSLGLTAPRLPSICISHAVLTAPLERSPCPNQRSLLSQKEVEPSSSSFASSALDLTLATSSGLILQICLIMALSLCCKRCRFILVSGQVSLAWSVGLRTQELYTWYTALVREVQKEGCKNQLPVSDVSLRKVSCIHISNQRE